MIDLITDNSFTTKTIIDVDYADNLMLLLNTSAQAESLLHYLEQTKGSIDLYVNENKIDLICFLKERGIFILRCRLLKWVYPFTHLSSNISFAESDVNMCLIKVSSAKNTLSIIWKYDV